MVKQVLGIVLLLAGVGAAYLFGVPALAEVRAMQEDVETLENLITKTEQLNAVGSAVIERYQAVSPSDIARMDALIPDQIDNVKLILEIQQLAERYGLSVQQIDVSGTSSRELAGQVLNVVSFQMELLGFYPDFVDFLEQLELSQRIIDPESITFQAIENETGYSYALTLDTYWKE